MQVDGGICDQRLRRLSSWCPYRSHEVVSKSATCDADVKKCIQPLLDEGKSRLLVGFNLQDLFRQLTIALSAEFQLNSLENAIDEIRTNKQINMKEVCFFYCVFHLKIYLEASFHSRNNFSNALSCMKVLAILFRSK